jgi:hypothetical protein
LPKVTFEQMPSQLVSFNDLRRAVVKASSVVHFYKDDYKFAPFLIDPLADAYKFQEFKGIITPDVSITSGMSVWEKRNSIFVSRSVGACIAMTGISVVPMVRWDSKSDCEMATCGLEAGTVIAVSTVGVFSSPDRRRDFIEGFALIVDKLRPTGIIVYGSWLKELDSYVSQYRIVNYRLDANFNSPPKSKEQPSASFLW